MQASLAIREKAAQLLAADATTLADPTSVTKVALVQTAFTPSEGLVLADVTLANFDGSTPIGSGAGDCGEGLDPNNTNAIISLKVPAGGWRWETSGITNLPQTIYGYVLTNNAGSVVYASERLETPVTLTAINQVILIGPLKITQLAGSMF